MNGYWPHMTGWWEPNPPHTWFYLMGSTFRHQFEPDIDPDLFWVLNYHDRYADPPNQPI